MNRPSAASHSIQTDFIKILWERSDDFLGSSKTRNMFQEAYRETCEQYPALRGKVLITSNGVRFDYDPEALDEIEYLTIRGGLLAMTHTLQDLLRFCGATRDTASFDPLDPGD